MTAERVAPLHLLVATDDSEPAHHAESWISRLRWSRPRVVDVLCVAGHGITRLGWGMHTYREPVRQAVEDIRQGELLAAQRIANEVGERLQQGGLTVRTWARQGDAAEEILAHIDLEQPDMVVVGPQGRSGLARLLLGSVSSQVIASAGRPVLVARRPASERGPLPEHLLILVDGSPGAERSIAWIVEHGWAIGSRVTILGMLGVPAGVDSDEPEAVSALQGIVRGDAATSLERLAEPLRQQAETLTIELEIGHPIEGALRASEELAADVVVVACPPRRRGQDPFAAKVARYLPASVLIVPQV
jgi:nucleotide-binding universal stress UspA family protein